ncbi:MAG: multidrug effflux MFS transporter, partial [Neisseriaceae bacterium]|nr:multidrug effflux MFS transporter [Neisseriaceae bacterium]
MKINKSSNFILIWILAFMSALAPLATDMYLPSMGAVQKSFATTQATVQLSITVFFVAFAFGQLLYGPISDALGRRKPLIFGIIIYTVASFACAAVNSIHLFVLFRFLQALGGCAGVVIARAIINDKFDIKQGASVMAIMMMIGSLAPMLAPSVGSLIVQYAPWQAVFALLGIFGLMLLAMMIWGLPETAKIENNSQFNLLSVLKNYASIIQDSRFMILVLTFALPLSSLFAYITTASFVFQDYFHLSQQQFGVVFGINVLGS